MKNRLALAVLAALPLLGGAAPQQIDLNGSAGGKRFDGIGVVDGGGATSVLLKDYPEPQRSQILDLIYQPRFGASVSALLVEIPGDGNSTQGSMPSHAHTREDLNYRRGYTWWIMQEARRRNPALSLDGAAWSAPGWLGTGGTLYPPDKAGQGDRKFFSDDTVNYYLSWLRGLRDVHGLRMDAIGIRNEKGVSYGFAKALRRGLDAGGFRDVKTHGYDNWPDAWKFDFVHDMLADADLRDALDIVGAHINAPTSRAPAAVQAAAASMNKPLWNTEQHVYKAGYEGLIGIVQAFNDNYVHSGATKIVNWYGIAALYSMESYSGVKEAAVRANWPWSGHYELNQSLWGYAHYGQFSEIGWTYLNGASGTLEGGGTYVTLKSPASDYSVIIETKDATAPQQLRLRVGGGLSHAPLAVWRSNAREQFTRLDDIALTDGAAAITLEPGSAYSLTTTRGQRKGGYDRVPAPAAFPYPYYETFEQYGAPERWGYLPRYFADIAGAFELSSCPGGKGACLHQAAPVPTLSWAPDWQPYTIIGDDQWRDYEVSADVYLDSGEAAAVMGRVNDVGTGYGYIPKGYFLKLDDSGLLQLVLVRGKVDKKKLVGDAEQQALIQAQKDGGEGGEKLLASSQLPGIAARQWHRLSLRFEGAAITALVDGKQVLSSSDSLYGHGMAGLLAVRHGDRLSMPYFDNVLLNGIGASTPAAAGPAPASAAIYPGR